MRITEQEEEEEQIIGTTEGRRITIRLGSGSGAGTNTTSYGSRRVVSRYFCFIYYLGIAI